MYGTILNISLDEDPVRVSPQTIPNILVSNETLRTIQWILYVGLCEIIVYFGIVTNIINIVCFIKQGFKDAINVSLLGLAISDLCCLLALVFLNICFNPKFQALDLLFEPVDVQYLIGSWLHTTFTRVTGWITAFITLERCMCVTIPLKVKMFITPKRVAFIVTGIFVLIISSISPVYYVNRLGWRFSPRRNKTLIGLVFTSDRQKIESICFAVSNICVPISAFVMVIVCTATLVINLRNKTRWRKTSTVAEQAQVIADRDQRVAKLVIVMSTLFIVCYFPVCLFFVAIIIVPGLSVDGRYINLMVVISCIVFLLQSTNAAMNIFIYYHMSSKYRLIFRQLFKFSSGEVNRPPC